MMSRRKHKPQRTCIACREVKEKHHLIRVVRTPEKKVIVDVVGKANGRGAYLCRQKRCWEKVRKEQLAQALKIKLSSEEKAVLNEIMQIELSKA